MSSWEPFLNYFLLVQLEGSLEVQGQEISLQAAMLLLRGKAYDALENRQRAMRWYKAALRADPFCYEAFKVSLSNPACAHGLARERPDDVNGMQLLVENHMLTSKEEYDLVESLQFQPEHQWLQLLYRQGVTQPATLAFLAVCWLLGRERQSLCRAKCKKYDQQSTLEATLERLEAPTATAPHTPADSTMQDMGSPTPETPSQSIEFEMSLAGLDSATGVSHHPLRKLKSPQTQAPDAEFRVLQVRTRSMAARTHATPSHTSKGQAPPVTPKATALSGGCGLADNLDVLVCRADWLHYLGAYQVQLTATLA